MIIEIMKRILLNQIDFEKLTRGEIVRKDDVEIALSDIGFYNMIDIIEHNLVGSEEQRNFKEKNQLRDPDNASFIAKLKEKLKK